MRASYIAKQLAAIALLFQSNSTCFHMHTIHLQRKNHNALLTSLPPIPEETTESLNGGTELVNSDTESLFAKLESVDEVKTPEDLKEAPPLSFDKYLTMQDKRVVVTIRYSQGAGLRPYFLTVAKKIKSAHPDVVLERLILPSITDNGDLSSTPEAKFEVLVDGRILVGKGRSSKQKVGLVDMTHARSVFVSMSELESAIARSRRKRRPSTTYGGDNHEDKMFVAREEMLRRLKEGVQDRNNKTKQ